MVPTAIIIDICYRDQTIILKQLFDMIVILALCRISLTAKCYEKSLHADTLYINCTDNLFKSLYTYIHVIYIANIQRDPLL